jgi:acyl-coenzyme A synthetase/AMP-(fatty) acid ligase
MWVRGTSSAPCYWNRPDKTAETMRGDWIYTGDRFLEKDGYYHFQGRADDLIKALQDHVTHTLLRFKYPRFVEFIGELPKTGTGKIDRQALAAMPVREPDLETV